MGIWIRSQDKRFLIECNDIVVDPSDNSDYYIYAYCKNYRICLGTYSTKEKALKVLDMIQREINNEYIRDYMVFQMPDDEVK